MPTPPELSIGLDDLARVLGDYQKRLLEQGFKREEAIHLVVSYQEMLVTGNVKTREVQDA